MSFFDVNRLLDGIEKNVVDQVKEAAAAALEEYPAQDAPQNAVQPADWGQAPQAISFWRLHDLAGKKQEFRQQLQRIAAERISKDRSSPSLIRRAEEAEEALSGLCSLLLDAPDVVPFLCEGLSAQETIKELQKEKRRLQKDTAAAEKEASTAVTVVSQVQAAEAARAELAQQLEAEQAKVARLQQEAAAQGDLQLRCSRQAQELEQARGALASLQAEHQRAQNELFEVRASRDARAAAEQADAELAAREHEAALLRVRELEHELQRTAAKLRQAQQEQQAAQQQQQQQQAPRQPGLQREGSGGTPQGVQRLAAELERARAAQGEAAQQAEALSARLQAAEAEVSQLRGEVAGRLSREQSAALRERLRAAEALLDGTRAVAEGEGPAEEGPHPGSPAAALVASLQGRNRQLVSDSTALRQRAEAAEAGLAAAQQQLAAEQAARAQAAATVERLEADLLASSQGAAAGEQPEGSSGGGGGSHEGGLLQIVAGQRDRFRQRVQQLEGELGAARAGLAGAEGRASALQADNLALYERLRYVQRFAARQAAPLEGGLRVLTVDGAGVPTGPAGGRAHRLSCGPLQLQLGGREGGGSSLRSRGQAGRFSCFGGGDDADEEAAAPSGSLEQKYSEAYEAKINPFTEFQARERDGRMSAHERALLSGSKALLASRAGRAFAIAYLLALHLFLFSLVYYIIIAAA